MYGSLQYGLPPQLEALLQEHVALEGDRAATARSLVNHIRALLPSSIVFLADVELECLSYRHFSIEPKTMH